MIQEIQLNNVATYVTPVSMQPLDINFCYGSNGSGKSTLANGISGKIAAEKCCISWMQEALPVLTYSKDFIEANFGERIGGIFTLGEESKEAQGFIISKSSELETIDGLILSLKNSKIKIEQEQQQAKYDFENVCWAIQQAHGETFAKALVGYRASKDKFAQKCLAEYPNIDKESPPDTKYLEELYSAAYGAQKESYRVILPIDIDSITRNETCDLLGRRITGSIDAPVGKFIEYLQNSDWVKQGFVYSSRSDGKCPYCQQIIPENIQKELTAFFDESYEKDCNLLATFAHDYSKNMGTLLEAMRSIIKQSIPILEYELFRAEVENLAKTIEANSKMLSSKISSPGTVVSIESLLGSIQKLNDLITAFNEKISRNNDIVKNQAQNQAKCTAGIWNFFAYELREVIAQYQKKIVGFSTGCTQIDERLRQEAEKKTAIRRQITEKEETLTSVLPTVNAINSILERFGFIGFKLAESAEAKGSYVILRPDGSNAKKTLSEGEHNFISFLYFFHLVYGSFERSGVNQNKVVVIDDPISSLDSNVLFIITTLTKTLITDCLANKHGIKQIFILTHNVYFHKEITFRGSGSRYSSTKTAYWIIRKKEENSSIVKFETNPIQTSYELLWSDLKDTGNTQRVTIFNTLRRILEYYFNIIGGLNYEKCINEFEGQDKIVCKALVSSINDGSHFISDDFVMCYESDTLENYLRVFRLIFHKMGHENHYKMMMREADTHCLENDEHQPALEAVSPMDTR